MKCPKAHYYVLVSRDCICHESHIIHTDTAMPGNPHKTGPPIVSAYGPPKATRPIAAKQRLLGREGGMRGGVLHSNAQQTRLDLEQKLRMVQAALSQRIATLRHALSSFYVFWCVG